MLGFFVDKTNFRFNPKFNSGLVCFKVLLGAHISYLTPPVLPTRVTDHPSSAEYSIVVIFDIIQTNQSARTD